MSSLILPSIIIERGCWDDDGWPCRSAFRLRFEFGLMMPGLVLLKARYYQEIAPKVAMDRAEIVSMTETVKTPAGEFKNCLKVEETTPLEPGEKEYKYYASGIGLIQDGSLKLVKHGKADR